MAKTENYNSIKWDEHFCLDVTSPSGLSRRNDFYMRSCHITPRFSAGACVGSRSYLKNGNAHSWDVTLNKSSYKVHRIIWILLHGSIKDGYIVDHLDGDPFNNHHSNLAVKTLQQNSQNICKKSNNTSGVTGVSVHTVKKKGATYTYWTSQWRDSCKRVCSKSFSVAKLGYETAKQLAIEHRNLQITLLNAAGASYTKRHCGLTPGTPPSTPSIQPT